MLLEVRALLQFARLPPVQTPSDARKRIRLAYMALTRMPADFDSAPGRLLVEGSLLARALDAVGQYLDHDHWPNPGELNRQLMVATIGPSEAARNVHEGITALVRAVDEMHHRATDLATVARRADRAARCACQASEWGTYTSEALSYLEEFQDAVYGQLPPSPSHPHSQPTPPLLQPIPPSSNGGRAGG